MYLIDFKQKEGRVKKYPTSSAILQKNPLFSMGSFCFCRQFKNLLRMEFYFQPPFLKGVFPQGGVPMTLIPEIAICPSECANLSITTTDVCIHHKLTCLCRMPEKKVLSGGKTFV